MGEITKAQYDYWIEKGHDESGEYMSQLGFDIHAPNKDIPKKHSLIENFTSIMIYAIHRDSGIGR